MSARQELTKGVTGQKIWFYPQEGRPSATPTVEIFGSGGSSSSLVAAANTYVTQSTCNTALSVAASAGAKSITLAATTGIEWRKTYLITNALGQMEWVRPMSINTSTKVVTLDEPLEFAHAITTTTFQGTSFYYTAQTAVVADLGELYRARAVYTAGGQQYKSEVAFDVVLVPLVNPLTVEFLQKRRPGIMSMEGSSTRGSDFADAREVAWDRVMKAIRKAGTEPHQWRPALLKTADDVEEWASAELDLQLWNQGVDVLTGDWDPERAQIHLEDRCRAERDKALSSLQWMDNDDDDGRADDEIRPSRGPDFVR